MSRTPIRQQNGAFGTTNPATRPGFRGPPPLPVVRMPGPAHALEHFDHKDLDPRVARALNQLQQNVRAALGAVKALPFSDGNLLENVPLVLGGPNGAKPYTILQHGLKKPFRGYDIKTIKGGTLSAHSLIPNDNPQGLQVAPLDSNQLQLWTLFTSFGGTLTADIWVYA